MQLSWFHLFTKKAGYSAAWVITGG
jgi:hypothetical protein